MKTWISCVGLMGGLLSVSAAVAAEPQTPQAFMEHLYQRFEGGKDDGRSDWARGAAGDAFDPSLARLIRRYTAAADKAQSAGLDYVPFCGCNDDSGLHYRVKASSPTRDEKGGDKATAAVTVTSDYPQAQKPFVLNYDLVKTPAGWRVFDIHSTKTPSLRKEVADNLRTEYKLRP